MNTARVPWPTVIALAVVLACGAAGTWWLLQPSSGGEKPALLPAPAKVDKILKEEQINLITLTDAALKRVNLQSEKVVRKPMARTRVYGGEVTIPPGRTIIVSAPMNGTLQISEKGLPGLGAHVKKGQEVFRLLPLLTPEGRANLATAQIDAEGQVKNARTALDAATITLNRAKQLLKDEAGSQRAVDDAQAQHDLAQKNLEAMTARRDLLVRVLGQVEKGTAEPLPIGAPVEGMLRNLSALPGQSVPAGAALFEIGDYDKVWVRVPVYVGDQDDIDPKRDASVGPLTARPGDKLHPARRVDAPPTANSAAGTVDLYFELDNRVPRFSPGHRISVAVTLKGEADYLVVPWQSVVHDIYGGTWVYEQTGDHTFVRRRVVVRWVAGDSAVLASGPPVGARVVTAGAAELFGTEVGFTK